MATAFMRRKNRETEANEKRRDFVSPAAFDTLFVTQRRPARTSTTTTTRTNPSPPLG